MFGFISDWFNNDDHDDDLINTSEKPFEKIEYNRFSNLLPWTAWLPDERLFVLEKTDEKGESKIEAVGYCLEVNPQTGASEEMVDLLTNIFQDVPVGTGIQVILYGSPDLRNWLGEYNAVADGCINDKQRAIVKALASRREKHYQYGTEHGIAGNNPYLLRTYRICLAVTVPVKNTNDIDEIRDIAKDISLQRDTHVTLLRTYYQFKYEWNPDHLVNWMSAILNPYELQPELNYDEGRELREQVIAPNTAYKIIKDGIKIGNNKKEVIATSFSVRSYPKPTYFLAQIDGLIGDPTMGALGYPCPFLIVMGAKTQDFETSRNTTTLKHARATTNAESPMARFMPEMAEKKRDWDIMLKSHDSGKGAIKIYHQLILFSPEEINAKACQNAVSVWRSQGFEIAPDTFMQSQAFLASLPMSLTPSLQNDIEKAKRFTTKTVYNAINMSPFVGEWSGIGKPIIPLFGRRGQAMGIDLFANETGNYNGCVVGASGSGKSAFLNELALRYLATGAKVWIIDVGRSFEKLCHTVGGQYIEFTEETKLILNPFTMVTNIEEDMDMLKNLIGQMMSPSKPLTDYEMSQVEINLRELWDVHGRNTTITMLADKLMNFGRSKETGSEEGDLRVRDLGVQLVSFTEKGAYGKYFTGETNVNFDNNFVVLELEELNNKKALQSVIMLLVMYKITQEMYLAEREQPKIVIIDEAWDLMQGGSTAGFIEKGYRRVRKYKGGFLTGTQSVEDYYRSDGARAALENADWMFLLRQKAESISTLEKSGRLAMSPHLKKMMLSITTLQGVYSEVLVHCGQMGMGIGRLFFDKFSLLLNSSKAEDFEAIKRYRESGMDTVSAIEQVMRDRGQL